MNRSTVPLAGIERRVRRARSLMTLLHPERLLSCRLATAGLAIACAFAAGFSAAVWTVGMILSAP